MQIYPKGDRTSPIWVVVEAPYGSDEDKGYVFSGAAGWHFDRIWSDAGLPAPYIIALKDDPSGTYDDNVLVQQWVSSNRLGAASPNEPQPRIIVALGERSAYHFCPSTAKRVKKKDAPKEASLDKWAGSLLTCPFIGYDHYIIPTYAPDFVVQNWWYRDIQVNIDLGHVREEYEFLAQHGRLKPLDTRELITEPTSEKILDFFYEASFADALSLDIETIRPKTKSKIFEDKLTGQRHPGYPYTLSLAISPYKAISFSYWDYDDKELVKIWSSLCELLRNAPLIIGQNIFCFDLHFKEALGFSFDLTKVQDTLIRHHILWPELEHKLQFLTRQYTRQPFYKDEGKHWSPKFKKQLMRYNCLDTCITYEVYLRQEDEFNDRPHLR